jgi:hypothetical protein
MANIATVDSDAASAAPKSSRPITWHIRGCQNNWNWKLSIDADEIVYQTRFPTKNLALVHKGAGPSALLLATINTDDIAWYANITFHTTTGDIEPAAWNPISMDNTAEESFTNRWPVKVRALGGRELYWEYEHLAEGNNSMYLVDVATREVLGDANDNYLALPPGAT